MPEETVPTPDNRPPEGEIPDILEWKLDVVMAQLARMGGGDPSEHNPPPVGGTRPRPTDPKKFDPSADEFPDTPGIPRILEWKLDVIIVQLGKLNVAINFWLATIVLWLIMIFLALLAIVNILSAIQALLGALLLLALFVVVQIAVPFIIARNRRRLRRMFPGSSP